MRPINSRFLLIALLGVTLGCGTLPAWSATHQGKSHVVRKHKAHKHPPKKHVHKAMLEESSNLRLSSNAAMVLDQSTGAVLFEKNAGAVLPIASITKLMTAMVALDAQPNLDETLMIDEDDVDLLKGTHSRLKVGTRLSREDMLRLALMSSENRAASALSQRKNKKRRQKAKKNP